LSLTARATCSVDWPRSSPSRLVNFRELGIQLFGSIRKYPLCTSMWETGGFMKPVGLVGPLAVLFETLAQWS
jgi:hypothetical protein